MEYGDSKGIVLTVNENNNFNYYPLLYCTYKNDVEITKLLIDYANKHNIVLNMNGKSKNGIDLSSGRDYPLLWSISQNNFELTKLLINYARKNNITLNLHEKDINSMVNKSSSHSYSTCVKSISDLSDEIINLLYRTKNENVVNLILNNNSNNNNNNSQISKRFDKIKNEINSLVSTVKRNNIEELRSLIDTADRNNNVLNIGDKDSEGKCPLLWCIVNNNVEMMRLLIDYADKNDIVLKLEEKDLIQQRSISEISGEIINLMSEGKNRNRINVVFASDTSELSNVLKNGPAAYPSTGNGDLVIALYDYNGVQPEELSIRVNEYIVVTDWNKNGFAYGYKRDNPQEKGAFPPNYVSKVDNNAYGGNPYQMPYAPQGYYPYYNPYSYNMYPNPNGENYPQQPMPPYQMPPYQQPMSSYQQSPYQQPPVGDDKKPEKTDEGNSSQPDKNENQPNKQSSADSYQMPPYPNGPYQPMPPYANGPYQPMPSYPNSPYHQPPMPYSSGPYPYYSYQHPPASGDSQPPPPYQQPPYY